MPASAVLAPVVALPAVRPEPFRLVRSGRGCPSCGDAFCVDPAECLYFLTSRPWADCYRCDGTGWSDDDCVSIFCETCIGSGLEEHDADSFPGISDRAAAKLAAYVDRLRVRLGVPA